MASLIIDDSVIREILLNSKRVAVVGHSDNPERTSYRIAEYLRAHDYDVIPVNPTVETIKGETSYPSVSAIPEAVDIVDVFRRSEFLDDVVEDAIKAKAKVIWTQLGVVDEAAAQKAIDAGIDVVMDRCIKVEHARLTLT